MDDVKLTEGPLLLPDPGRHFMLAMRHGTVELACCINPEDIDDDVKLAQIARALRTTVKSELNTAQPMTTVPGLLAWIERQFPVGEPTATYRSVTGEPYVRVGVSSAAPEVHGVVAEGALQEWAFDEETACMAAASAFRDYAEGRSGTLYWRRKPTLEYDPKRDRSLVYMRLLISDKPPISTKEN